MNTRLSQGKKAVPRLNYVSEFQQDKIEYSHVMGCEVWTMN